MYSGRPEPSGPMQDVVAQWVESKDCALRCPICRHTNFTAELVEAPPLNAQGSEHFEDGRQLVQLECGNCAHVLHFNAGKLGLSGPSGGEPLR
jgi:hypothetical protein